MINAIEDAVSLVSDTYESMGIPSTNDAIRRDVTSWYEHSDIVNPEMLGAGVLEYGSWKLISMNEWQDITDKWFPTNIPTYLGYPTTEELHEGYYDVAWQEGWA